MADLAVAVTVGFKLEASVSGEIRAEPSFRLADLGDHTRATPQQKQSSRAN